MYTYLD